MHRNPMFSLDRSRSPPFHQGEDMHRQLQWDLGRQQRDWDDELERVRRRFLRHEPMQNDLDFIVPQHRHHHVPQFFVEERIPNIMDHVPKTAVAPSHVDPDHFAVEFDMRKYHPENIQVVVEGDTLTVTATLQTDQYGSMVTSEFSKSVILPQHVDSEKLVSKMTPDGLLTVEMPAPPPYNSLKKPAPPSYDEVESQSEPYDSQSETSTIDTRL